MEKLIWQGVHTFIGEGETRALGDAPLIFQVERPRHEMWNEQNYFCVSLRVNQYSDVRLGVHFETRDGERVSVTLELIPNLDINFRVKLDELWSKRFFLPTFPGAYKVHLTGKPTHPDRISSITISIAPGLEFESARLTRVWLSDAQPEGVHPEKPIIDEMGQLIGRDWHTKTHTFEEMKARLEDEYARARVCAEPMSGLSAYGGYLKKRFEPSGFFRTHYDGERWWLADPEGYAFFSHGVCYGTRMGEFGWYTGMERFYENAPSPDDPRFAGAFTHPRFIAEYVKRNGETERSGDWMFNPARANMMRVFGDNWWEAWRAIAANRFRQWGINTTGVGIVNFIDERLEDFLRITKIPYAVTLKRFPVTERFIFRDFPDVFAPEYASNSQVFAQNELKPMANDPYLMGYFMHNEPEWMFQQDVNIAWELLVKDDILKSRAHFADWLKQKYKSAKALSEAWGVRIESFERLLAPLPRDTKLARAGQIDLDEYEQILIDAFGGIPMAACKRVAPNHLNMGLRYARVNDKILKSCRAFDIFSFNCYSKRPEEVIARARGAGKPMLIGEWHFGAPDNGLFRTALVSAATQQQRANAYRRYIETVAADKGMVGAHYFEYNNQTLMGRFDGEHMAHGIIDCTNKPYPLLAQAITRASQNLYGVLTGEIPPYDEPIEYLDPMW